MTERANNGKQKTLEEKVFERIYFGSQEIFLKRVSGEVQKYNSDDWKQERTSEQIEQVTQRLKPQQIDGIELPVIVPGIPALDFILKSVTPQDTTTTLPDLFQSPLVKCSHGDPFAIYSGLASGVRSGLIQVDHRWYRLKGCGNHDQGFTLRKRIHPTTTSSSTSSVEQRDWCDIRGCAFMNTTLRELFYTEKFSHSPTSLFIVSTNTSVGLMKYSDPELLPCGPSVQTTSIIQQTIGDRRFGTHILAGLELLLPWVVTEELIASQELLNLFPSQRPGREMNSLSEIIPTGPFISDYTLGTSQNGHDRDGKGLCWSDIPRDGTSLANITPPSCSIPLQTPPPSQYPSQWTRDGPKEMTEDWRQIWDQSVKKMKALLTRAHEKKNSPPVDHQLLLLSTPSLIHEDSPIYVTQVLNYLFSRCGYDCGVILATMHSHQVSWGTYQDAMCRRDLDEWHCNAHVNNLVLIPPPPPGPTSHLATASSSPLSHSFLSFLDLDMAYGVEEMVEIDFTLETRSVVGSEHTVKRESGGSSALFENILWREYVNMMEVLAGNDSSTGVPNAALSVTASYSPILRGVQSALSDTMVLAYQEAYRSHRVMGQLQAPPIAAAAVMEYDEDLHQAAYGLLELAIIIMAEYIA
jgi:hypothetical protein